MDRSVPKGNSALAGLSVRNGPVEDDDMDIDAPNTNGAKRKSRTSISKINYKDNESDSDGAPLVSATSGNRRMWA